MMTYKKAQLTASKMNIINNYRNNGSFSEVDYTNAITDLQDSTGCSLRTLGVLVEMSSKDML